MKILYFYQYFTTPQGSYGTRVYEFTKEWANQGHEVTVVSSVYYKSDLRATRFIDNRVIEGVNVKLINIFIDNKQSLLIRLWKFIQYSIVSGYYAVILPANVVIASSGPLTIAIPAFVARYIRSRRLVFEVRDLWPQGAIELDLIKSKWIQKLAYLLEAQCYRASHEIVTLSQGMTNDINSRFNLDNLTTVTNSANLELFKPEIDVEFKRQNGCYAVYTGNIGAVNNSRWLVEAARCLKLKGRADIKIILIGDGQQRAEIQRIKNNEELDSLILFDLMPKHEVVKYISNAMVSLVPLKGSPILDTSSPNKFFESLACGVPVIQNTQGWMKDFLLEHNVGYTLPPDDANALADILIDLSNKPTEITEIGKRARQVAEKIFDKTKLASKMLSVLERAAK
jgi:glycosyltransferase involved in cell wall biosynthesis